ncbi:MAG: hypothetical protein ABH867_00045 [Patescibacteria group bacterium]|nr:hypothetical protein [Patescibacteria group bacterium]
MADLKGNNIKRFRIRKKITEEDRIRHRAIVFGLLTVFLTVAFIVWGFPIFVKVVGFFGDLKSELEQEEVKDLVPPLAPRLSYIPEATNSATMPLSGFTEPKAKVMASFNQETLEMEADEEGNFSIEGLTLDQGTNSLSFWAEDESGNKSEVTETFEIIYDRQPPELVIESPQNKIAVETQIVEVKGQTEPSGRVLVNDHIVILDEEGKFVEQVTLREGGNEIVVLAEDRAGNQTKELLNITYLP